MSKPKIPKEWKKPDQTARNLNKMVRNPATKEVVCVWDDVDIDIHNITADKKNKIIRCFFWNKDVVNICGKRAKRGLISGANYKKHLNIHHYEQDQTLKDQVESQDGTILKCYKVKFDSTLHGNKAYVWYESNYELERKRRTRKAIENDKEVDQQKPVKKRKFNQTSDENNNNSAWFEDYFKYFPDNVCILLFQMNQIIVMLFCFK